MKQIIKYFLFLLALPTIVLAASSNGTNIDVKDSNNNLSRPYIIEEVSPKGDILSTKSGISGNTDPFLISEDLGAGPYQEDRFSAFPDIKMNIGSKITLYRAPVYKIKDGRKEHGVRSWTHTVGELLAEKNIELGVDDKINFSGSTELEEGMQVVINRVAITTVIEPEVIAYKTVRKNNPNVEKGNKKILQSGANGKRNKFYLVTRQDGEEVSRKLTKTEVAEEPVDEILEIGTKVVVYGSGKATYYNWPSMESKNKYYAASKTIPKGTEVWVVNTANGKGVKVTILDWVGANVAIDLSETAFDQIANKSGVIDNVRIEKYYPE